MIASLNGLAGHHFVTQARRRTAVACALWLLVLLTAFIPSLPTFAAPDGLPGILGPDDRVPFDSVAWPWAAIGRVNRATGGFCTGTLIGSRHVLTAAHCLFDRGKRRIRPADIHFVAGYRRGTYLAHSVARRLIIPEGYRPAIGKDAAGSVDALAADWAVLVLQEPLDIRPIPVQAADRALSSGDRLIRAGYGQDRAHLLSVHEGCGILGQAGDGRLLFHSCDATWGDSGSPLLLRSEDRVVLIGIDIGSGRFNGADRGLAVSAAQFDASLRAILAGQ